MYGDFKEVSGLIEGTNGFKILFFANYQVFVFVFVFRGKLLSAVRLSNKNIL